MKFANGEWYVDQSVHSSIFWNHNMKHFLYFAMEPSRVKLSQCRGFPTNSLRISGTINSKTAETSLSILLLWELKNESIVCMQISLWRTYDIALSLDRVRKYRWSPTFDHFSYKVWKCGSWIIIGRYIYTLGDNMPVFNAFVLRFNKKIEGVSS